MNLSYRLFIDLKKIIDELAKDKIHISETIGLDSAQNIMHKGYSFSFDISGFSISEQISEKLNSETLNELTNKLVIPTINEIKKEIDNSVEILNSINELYIKDHEDRNFTPYAITPQIIINKYANQEDSKFLVNNYLTANELIHLESFLKCDSILISMLNPSTKSFVNLANKMSYVNLDDEFEGFIGKSFKEALKLPLQAFNAELELENFSKVMDNPNYRNLFCSSDKEFWGGEKYNIILDSKIKTYDNLLEIIKDYNFLLSEFGGLTSDAIVVKYNTRAPVLKFPIVFLLKDIQGMKNYLQRKIDIPK